MWPGYSGPECGHTLRQPDALLCGHHSAFQDSVPCGELAEEVRFELTRGFRPYRFSRPAPSTTRPFFQVKLGGAYGLRTRDPKALWTPEVNPVSPSMPHNEKKKGGQTGFEPAVLKHKASKVSHSRPWPASPSLSPQQKWRKRWDSNPRDSLRTSGTLAPCCLRPLGHSSR